MRTKTLLLSALACAVGVSAASAQVYSVNAVGYVNKDLVPGFNVLTNPLDAGSNALDDILPTLPDGSSIFFFRDGGFTVSAEYIDGFGWFSGDELPEWNAGEGAFLSVPSATTVTFVGEVRQGNLQTALSPGFNLVGSQVPQSGSLEDLSVPGNDGDSALFWNEAAQAYGQSADYIEGFGWFSDPEVSVDVAQGFFINASTASSWDRDFSVNN